MSSRLLRIAAGIAIVGIALVQLASTAPRAQAFSYARMNRIQRRLLSGLADMELNPQNATSPAAPQALQRSAAQRSVPLSTTPPENYLSPSADGCPERLGADVKVNRNCLNLTDIDLAGRAQANNETSIAHDPLNPRRLVASANDYRRGDGNCYTAYSRNQGDDWADSTVPMGFVRGASYGANARQYWQSGGDTSVAFDTKGNAYLSCQVFNRGAGVTQDPDQSSGLLVFRSTLNGGASWNFPGRIVAALQNSDGSALLDKQLMTVDNHLGSPYQDRVYVTWTLFASDGTAYIYESYSADYGESFSDPVLVSGNSTLCANAFGLPTPQGSCNENQFSQPFTGPDGALYVAWANFNNGTGHPVGDPDAGGETGGAGGNAATITTPTPIENFNQMLLAKSTDGGRTFGAPVKVADYYDLPDCATYQGKDAGRSCVPEKGSGTNSFFRATNYPVGAVNPRDPQQVVVTFGSYINAFSQEQNGCVPAGFSPDTGIDLYLGVKTPGACNNGILLSASRDGGQSFTGTTTNPRKLTLVTQSPGQRTTDQWFQWAEFSSSGRLAVSYYDRQYGDDETTGYSDFSLSVVGGGDERSGDRFASFRSRRATSSPMPPPTQFGGVFYGDYTGLTVAGDQAFPIWSDTRTPALVLCPGTGQPGVPPQLCQAAATNAPVANDQDIFTRGMGLNDD